MVGTGVILVSGSHVSSGNSPCNIGVSVTETSVGDSIGLLSAVGAVVFIGNFSCGSTVVTGVVFVGTGVSIAPLALLQDNSNNSVNNMIRILFVVFIFILQKSIYITIGCNAVSAVAFK